MVEIKIGNESKNSIIIFSTEDVNILPSTVKKIMKDPKAKDCSYFIYDENIDIYVCAGEKKKIENNTYRLCASIGFNQAVKLKLENAQVKLLSKEFDDKAVQSLCEGIYISAYEFNAYKKDAKSTNITIFFDIDKSLNKIIDRSNIVNNQVNLVRDLVNKSNHEIHTLSMCNLVEEKGKEYGLKTRIIDNKEMKELGMELLLAVGAGGATPPRIAIIEYKGNKTSNEIFALVGKGMVYDTGGLNIKPTGSMETMRDDMTGSAVVLGTILSLAELKIHVNVTGFLALADNGVDAMSYKPGDTFKAYNGKFVEIGNTDAEGRLVLADTIAYAVDKYKPAKIIDLATLTGACMVALGAHAAGVMTNNDNLADDILSASKQTDEYMWKLPMWEEFSEAMKGDFADLKNSASARLGGAMTGAAFIKEFVNDTPWAHIDIAGFSYLDSPFWYYGKGATGAYVRTMVTFFENNVK
ncbi:MAG: leucyl aminopeptidase [bacterium]